MVKTTACRFCALLGLGLLLGQESDFFASAAWLVRGFIEAGRRMMVSQETMSLG